MLVSMPELGSSSVIRDQMTFSELKTVLWRCDRCGVEIILENQIHHTRPYGWVSGEVNNPHSMFESIIDLCLNCSEEKKKKE